MRKKHTKSTSRMTSQTLRRTPLRVMSVIVDVLTFSDIGFA